MANFKWIEEAPETDWGAGMDGRHAQRMPLAEFARRSECTPETAIREFRAWVWSKKGPSYAVGWTSNGNADDTVVLMRNQ